jgi:dihydrofolate synthase/folylpolyglutamate synthase
MNYQECLDYLHGLGHELRGVCFRLETIIAILAKLGDPHRQYGTAVVAGTNGKGSTSAILSSIVQQAGYRTGLYTSPHLIRINERFRVNGRDIPDEDFAAAFTQVRQAVEELLREGGLESRPSFFEFLTATAFVHFARAQVEFAVLEVGMGGRLDATNVTEPRVVVITNIDLDHQEFLGTTHEEIAREKAGVIKPGRPVVSACVHPEAARAIRQRCEELGAPLFETAGLCQVTNLLSRAGHYHFDFSLNGDFFPALVSPLLGRFQVDNAVAAVTAAWQLRNGGMDRITRAAIQEGLRCTSWPGRLEILCESPLFLLDGAHNPAGAREVAAFARENLAGRKLRLLYASMRDKAVGEISEALWPLADEVYLTQPDQPRAAPPEEILALARCQPKALIIEPRVSDAAARALAASSPDDVLLAAGSLFLVGEIKKSLLSGRLSLPARISQVATAQP